MQSQMQQRVPTGDLDDLLIHNLFTFFTDIAESVESSVKQKESPA